MIRWDRVQILSLALASVMVCIYIQAYISTGLTPNTVLAWTPLTLILDAGSLLQILVLIVEEITLKRFIYTVVQILSKPWRIIRQTTSRHQSDDIRAQQHGSVLSSHNSQSLQSITDNTITMQAINNNGKSVRTSRLEVVADLGHTDIRPETVDIPYTKSLIACLALILLIMVVIIQIIAVVAATRGKRIPNLETTWCSPMFAPMVLSVLDGSCIFHEVISRQIWGMGCIKLPAYQANTWLIGTTVFVSLSLGFQLIDLCVLTLVHKGWREVKMKRPWLTTFGGMLILIIIAVYGTLYASRIPVGITDLVWVFHWESVGKFSTVCTTELNSAGLRGAFISWFDGLFNSWGSKYYGF